MSSEDLEWWCVKSAAWMQHIVHQTELGATINAESCDLAEGQRLLEELDRLVEKMTATAPETAA
jgi:hypothetical protein